MKVLVTMSIDDGIDYSAVIKVKSVKKLYKKIINDEVRIHSTYGKHVYNSSLKEQICMRSCEEEYEDNNQEYEYISLSVEQIKEAVLDSYIDGDSRADLRFWKIEEDRLLPLKL